ncbi:MAG TPA: hypothetical protein PKH33_07880 [bacterium]|nr:hypothetical protein [bacterium]
MPGVIAVPVIITAAALKQQVVHAHAGRQYIMDFIPFRVYDNLFDERLQEILLSLKRQRIEHIFETLEVHVQERLQPAIFPQPADGDFVLNILDLQIDFLGAPLVPFQP